MNMTLTSLEQQAVAFTRCIEQWEASGLRGCAMMHDCRSLVSSIVAFQTQVKRATDILHGNAEDKVALALKELGDYVVIP